ncbi:hypothetical protein PanWU01x14_316800 [Parasponia andersonii]|uniref:Zinc knuckle CX2CX4HX4C n=1 Tax=Parasponia andersonii TaxID=3476 RepID=A0A2P5AMT2_PARAD|nr:hypothetical protein PanWU01x14_316800 [Parasponia andersonii]
MAVSCPFKIDQAILNGDINHYARVLVDVDHKNALLDSIQVDSRDECRFVYLFCERLQDFCTTCSLSGHVPSKCYHNKLKDDKDNVTKKSYGVIAIGFCCKPKYNVSNFQDDQKSSDIPLQNISISLFEDEVASVDILAKGKAHADEKDEVVIVNNTTSQDDTQVL